MTRNSAKLTNQCVSYAFTFSPFSIHVRHILPTSKFQHSYSCILLIFYISEQHVWELWVWIQFTGLTFSLRVTPMNNPITLITSTVAGLHFCCRWQSVRSSAYFRTVFSQNAKPLDAEHETQYDHSRSFKVIRFGVNEEPLRGYIVQYNYCGVECGGPEDIASEKIENRHLRRPHSHLTPPL